MEESFFLDVDYKGETMEFEGWLLVTGYQHKIEMDLFGTKVLFEPDEERNYRAVVGVDDLNNRKLDRYLFQAVAERLESLLKN